MDKIAESLEIILDRTSNITCVNDFLTTQSGMLLLDGVCMKLIAVGESVKNLDKVMNERSFRIIHKYLGRELWGCEILSYTITLKLTLM